MLAINPQQAAEAAAILTGWAASACLQKYPQTLTGLTKLGADITGLAAGTVTPIQAGPDLELFLGELGLLTNAPVVTTGITPAPGLPIGLPGLPGLINEVVNQVAASKNPLAPDLLSGMIGTVLTTVGGAVSRACALYAAENPAPAAAAAKTA